MWLALVRTDWPVALADWWAQQKIRTNHGLAELLLKQHLTVSNSTVNNLFFFITQMLTNVKLAQPTVMIMRTVQTQRAHLIVVVKLDLQEMEPTAPVRRVTEHPLFTVIKTHGHDRKRRILFFWSKFTDCSVSNYWVFSILKKSIYNFFADNFYNCLSLLDGDWRLTRLVINSDLTHIGILSSFFLTFFCSFIHYLPQTLTSVQLNRLNVTSMPSVWTYRALLTALVKPVLPEMEQCAKVCRMKHLVRPVIKTINYLPFTKEKALNWN